MRNLTVMLGALVLSATASAQAPPVQLPASGHVSGLVRAVSAELVRLEGVVDTRTAVGQYSISPQLLVDLVPPPNLALAVTQVSFRDVVEGRFERAPWLEGFKSVVGMAAHIEAVNGAARSMSVYVACTRERCSLPDCKEKCGASRCACPGG